MEIGGGYFNYEQNSLEFLANQLEHVITRNGDQDFPIYNQDVLNEFSRTIKLLHKTKMYVDSIDRLLSLNITDLDFLNELDSKLKSFNQKS